MKKMLLTSFFLMPAFVIVFAQISVRTSDSIYSLSSNTANPTLNSVIYNQYDSACRLSASQTKTAQAFVNALVNAQQNLYYYDAAGNLDQTIVQIWADTSYKSASRTTNTFDAGKHVTSILIELWENNSYWQPVTFDTTIYDGNGNISSHITQYWNADSMELVNQYLSVFGVNSQGKDTLSTGYLWHTATQAWVPDRRAFSHYNTGGLLVEENHQYWDGLQWQPAGTYTYYNNSKGLVDSSIHDYQNYNNEVDKLYYVYDSLTSNLQQLSIYNYQGEELDGAERNRYYHLHTDNQTTDTTYYELLINNTFVLTNESAFNLTFNDDRTIKDSIYSTNWAVNRPRYYTHHHFTYAPCRYVLPVSLISFTGTQKNNDALLQWQTTNEVNTSYFTLQRSTDGVTFSFIGNVTASGNSSGKKNYNYTDANITSLQSPKLYYRLVTTGKDGQLFYNKTAMINIQASRLLVYASPNPVAGVLYLYSSASLPGAAIRVHDMSGKVLYNLHQNITGGSKLSVNLSNLAKGMYIVTIQSATENYECKIVKE